MENTIETLRPDIAAALLGSDIAPRTVDNRDDDALIDAVFVALADDADMIASFDA